jgi:hypothetical protein
VTGIKSCCAERVLAAKSRKNSGSDLFFMI